MNNHSFIVLSVQPLVTDELTPVFGRAPVVLVTLEHEETKKLVILDSRVYAWAVELQLGARVTLVTNEQ